MSHYKTLDKISINMVPLIVFGVFACFEFFELLDSPLLQV